MNNLGESAKGGSAGVMQGREKGEPQNETLTNQDHKELIRLTEAAARKERGEGGEQVMGESVKVGECGVATYRASRSDSRRARMSFSRTGPLTLLQREDVGKHKARVASSN